MLRVIGHLIELCARHRGMVLLLYAMLALLAVRSVREVPLARAPGNPFDGGQADLDVMAIDQELARQGSPLRAYVHQRRRTFSARVVAGPRVCQITTVDGWCISFHDHTGERGWQYYDDAASAVAALRCWIERGDDVELQVIHQRV